MPGVRSDGQEEAVAARTWGQGTGGLGGKWTGAAGDLWRRWGGRSCPKPAMGVEVVVTSGFFPLKIVHFSWEVDCEKPEIQESVGLGSAAARPSPGGLACQSLSEAGSLSAHMCRWFCNTQFLFLIISALGRAGLVPGAQPGLSAHGFLCFGQALSFIPPLLGLSCRAFQHQPHHVTLVLPSGTRDVVVERSP